MEKKDLIGTTQPMSYMDSSWPNTVENDITLVPHGNLQDPNCPMYITTKGALASQAGAIGSVINFNGPNGPELRVAGGSETSSDYGTMLNKVLTDANAVYYITIPYGVIDMEITFRADNVTPALNTTVIRMSWNSDMSVCKAFTADREYTLSNHKFNFPCKLYFASSVAGTIVDIMTYIANPSRIYDYEYTQAVAAFSSSPIVEGSEPFQVLDANMSTRWLSANVSEPQFLTVDLGVAKNISGFRYRVDADISTVTYDVYTSLDNFNFTKQITDGVYGAQNVWNEKALSKELVRYIKMDFKTPHDGVGFYVVSDLEVSTAIL